MAAATSPSPEEDRLKVLLVDDNPENLRILYETLSTEGFDLRVANGGQAALDVARSVSPDLILLDVAMPEIDGFEVCQRIKSDPHLATATVIFLSAFDDTEAKVRGLSLGAVDFITKPFQPEEVKARVKTHLTIHRLQRQLTRRNVELQDAYGKLEKAALKMKADLDAAARVQQSLLPVELPECLRASFAWRYRPCDELAGDFLNVFLLSDKKVGVYVADVSGHGVASSLLAVSIAQTLTPQLSASSLLVRADPNDEPHVVSPRDVALELNRRFPMEDQNGLYFTILYGILDLDSLEFRYVSAGHVPLVKVGQEGAPVTVDGDGLAVGWMNDADYDEYLVQLQPGDRLFLYSDGIPEARNEWEMEFGMPRVLDTIRSQSTQPLDTSVGSLVEAIEQWCLDRPDDDVSVLGLEILAMPDG